MVSVAGAAISSLGVHHTERHFSLLPLALLLRSVAPAHTIPKRPLLSLSLSLLPLLPKGRLARRYSSTARLLAGYRSPGARGARGV